MTSMPELLLWREKLKQTSQIKTKALHDWLGCAKVTTPSKLPVAALNPVTDPSDVSKTPSAARGDDRVSKSCLFMIVKRPVPSLASFTFTVSVYVWVFFFFFCGSCVRLSLNTFSRSAIYQYSCKAGRCYFDPCIFRNLTVQKEIRVWRRCCSINKWQNLIWSVCKTDLRIFCLSFNFSFELEYYSSSMLLWKLIAVKRRKNEMRWWV